MAVERVPRGNLPRPAPSAARGSAGFSLRSAPVSAQPVVASSTVVCASAAGVERRHRRAGIRAVLGLLPAVGRQIFARRRRVLLGECGTTTVPAAPKHVRAGVEQRAWGLWLNGKLGGGFGVGVFFCFFVGILPVPDPHSPFSHPIFESLPWGLPPFLPLSPRVFPLFAGAMCRFFPFPGALFCSPPGCVLGPFFFAPVPLPPFLSFPPFLTICVDLGDPRIEDSD